MSLEYYEERVKASEEKIVKLRTTMSRHASRAGVMRQNILAMGWDPDNARCREGYSDRGDAMMAILEYQDKLGDIQSVERRLQEAADIYKKWLDKREEALGRKKIVLSMPAVFVQCQLDLATRWTEYDISQRESMLAAKRSLPRVEFRKIYKGSRELELSKSDEEFHKLNMRSAEAFIVDLYYRIYNITGEVVDYSRIHYGGKGLNGFVRGVNGAVEVETIGAGGYNIQRYHLRVLVHKR